MLKHSVFGHNCDCTDFCAVTCENGYVKLVNSPQQSFFIKDTLSRGRVVICINETFQTICEDGWGHVDASVLCSELGFSAAGKACFSTLKFLM